MMPQRAVLFLMIIIIVNTTDCKVIKEIQFNPTQYVRWQRIPPIYTGQNISAQCKVSKSIYQNRTIKIFFKLRNGTRILVSGSDDTLTKDEIFYIKTLSIHFISIENNPIREVGCAARKINEPKAFYLLEYPVTVRESYEPKVQDGEKKTVWINNSMDEDKFSLSCSARGSPTPAISWSFGTNNTKTNTKMYYNGNLVESTIYMKKSTLSSNSTHISCKATNFRGSKTKQFEILQIPNNSCEPNLTLSQKDASKTNGWSLNLAFIGMGIIFCVFVIWILSGIYTKKKKTFMPPIMELKNPEKTLVFQKQIGRGHFGQVSLYLWKTKTEWKYVAVKQLTNREDFPIFQAELKMLQKVGYHQNIIQYFGCVTKTKDISSCKIVVEYCENKDLLGFLRNNRTEAEVVASNSNLSFNFGGYEESISCFKFNLEASQLIKWAYDIANGMEYLHSQTREITVHRDLAARNVFLDANLIAKIGDFGLAKTLQREDDFYKGTPGKHLPWLWLPIEALEDNKFSLESDIWSFGVTMYEILSLGEQPYIHENFEGRKIKSSEILIEFLKTGSRMKFSLIANNVPYAEHLYKIMADCWAEDPHTRPSFKELKNRLQLLTSSTLACFSKDIPFPVGMKIEHFG